MNFWSLCIHLILIIVATQKTFGDRSATSVETTKRDSRFFFFFKTKDLGTNTSVFIGKTGQNLFTQKYSIICTYLGALNSVQLSTGIYLIAGKQQKVDFCHQKNFSFKMSSNNKNWHYLK